MNRSGVKSVTNASMTSKASSSNAVKVPQPPPGPKAASTMSQSSTVNPNVNFDGLVKLLEDQASSHQYERHAVELTSLLQQCQKGFSVRAAIDSVPRILKHLSNAVKSADSESVALLLPPMTLLLELCALPLQARTLDDQRKLETAIGGIMDAVAGVLYLPHSSLRATGATVLRQLFYFVRQACHDDINQDPNNHQKRKEYWKAVHPTTIQAIASAWTTALQVANEERAKEAELRAKAKKGDDDEEPDEGILAPTRSPRAEANAAEIVFLLKACVELSHYKDLCEVLTDCGACLLTCRTMKMCTAGDRRLSLCVELLWNLLLLHGPAAEACANTTCVQSLYEVFVLVLSMGYKLKERELRNDLIVLVTLIADCEQSLPLLIPFAELLLDLSCGAERESENPHVNPKFHHTTNHEELQMKTLSWKFLEKLCSASTIYAQAVFDWGFIDIVLRYINIHCEQPAVVRWSTEQLLDLQRSVLNILLLLAPLAGEYYVAGGAISTIVEYIGECPDKSLRNLAVGVLAAIARSPMRNQLAECGIIQLALELLQEEQQFDNTLRVDCLSILADVVDRDPRLQSEFLHWAGIDTVLPLLAFSPDYYTELKDSIIFGALDTIWSCVTGSEECEEAFVRQDGVHMVLSVLETCPTAIKQFPLTCLADLLRHPAAVVEFRSWTSEKTQRSAAQLLLSLWTGAGNNNSSTVVSVDDVRFDENSERLRTPPIGLRSIGASTQRTTLSAKPPHTLESGADAEGDEHQDDIATHRKGLITIPEDIKQIVEENALNFKIYCCMAHVGLDDHKELTALERSVLASVQVFVELCKDEMWNAVADSIANDGLQPVAADDEKLRRVREVALARCEELQATRLTLTKAHEEREAENEVTFYKTLIKKTDEKLPTTKGSALSITEAKIRKALMLKASFKAAMAKQQAHKSGSLTPNVQTGSNGSAAGGTPTPNQSTIERKSLVPTVAKGGPERWGMGQRAMSDGEYALLQMLNKVRTDPKSLIPHLKQKLTFLNDEGNAFSEPNKPIENCVEGAAPYNELIEMLEAARPIVTLLDVPMGLLLAARDHVNDLGKRMEATQDGADGSTPQMRMNRYGRVGTRSTQLLSLTHSDPIDVILQLAVDDGISSRIDRKSIFDPDMRVCGVAMGHHSIHENVAVILLAHEYTDKPPNEQRDIYLKFNSQPVRK